MIAVHKKLPKLSVKTYFCDQFEVGMWGGGCLGGSICLCMLARIQEYSVHTTV
jgi:hypothetical protein